MERNMVWNLVKNMPGALLERHCRRLIVAKSAPAPLHDGESHLGWLLGKSRGIMGINKMIKKRRDIQTRRRASLAHLDALLLSRTVVKCHL
jgi:hypothetical protein